VRRGWSMDGTGTRPGDTRAGVGGGSYQSVEEAVKATVKVTDRTTPIPEDVRRYEALYPAYRNLYLALKDTFHALS